MVFRVTGNTVITDDRKFVANTFSVNNDNGIIEILDTSPMVGTVAGYATGGAIAPGPSVPTIDKFPFATDTNATQVGNLTRSTFASGGQSSSTFGYTPGGNYTNSIDKFSFAYNGQATDVGDLTQRRAFAAGQSSSVHGYTSGGYFAPPGTSLNTIDKFPFAADGNATDVGDLTLTRYDAAGHSSATDGFTSGGLLRTGGGPVTRYNNIDRFSFATDNNASDVGDLTQIRAGVMGQSSRTHGYASGGNSPPSVNTIDKFLFSTSANATDVGDLSLIRGYGTGQSSLASGYASGGDAPSIPSPYVARIDKFPFATDTNATTVGNLSQARYYLAGQQD